MKDDTPRIHWLIALVPFAVLVLLQVLVIKQFGSDAIDGASQTALLFSAAVAVAIAMVGYKVPWKTINGAIGDNVKTIGPAILILFLIGAVSGSWMMSGVVPTMIYYGMKVITPSLFLFLACLICALVSLVTGSSWTTVATVGIALIGIGTAHGYSVGWTAGAIISGAYFGDKISPLSDTTVLASSVNGVPLFSHIRYMLFTTVPSFVITLVIFTVLGLTHGGTPETEMEVDTSVLGSHFHLTPWLLLVPAFTVWMIWKRQPAIMVLALSALVAAVAALIFQPDIVRGIGSAVASGSAAKVQFTGVVRMVYDSVSLDTGVAEVDQLLVTRGMVGMLNTVFLILCAMCFGACMKASGMIADLSRILAPLTRTRTGLVGSTVVTGTALNGVVSDQYLAILLTSNIYRDSFDKQGYEPRLLSRSVEDSATVTSPLFPWSSCGMTQATILSVPTLAYAPFCFFNLLSPLISILVAALGWKIVKPKKA